jgi:nucleoid-associated protein YgaU
MRYKNSTIITRNGVQYLGLRTPVDTTPQGDDRFYDVQPEDTLQKIAHSQYGDATLWWLVADYNTILDPFEELSPGDVLRLPSQSRLFLEILR